jgi:hypothetical protein
MQGRFGNRQWRKPSVHLLNSLGKPRAKPTKPPHTVTFGSIKMITGQPTTSCSKFETVRKRREGGMGGVVGEERVQSLKCI